jgi:hypothetical protein
VEVVLQLWKNYENYIGKKEASKVRGYMGTREFFWDGTKRGMCVYK